MTKTLQQLSSAVVKKLRSGIAFTNVAHCVEELVFNSIDAGANCIAVHLNLPFYQIQVIDNGCGIDVKQMKMIGTRYTTSKCHTLDDLQNLRSGGFRGEALSSLKEVSSVLMIESRAASSKETYCKIFTQGKSSGSKKSLNSRPSKGTTVTVYDFMYNMPVRKNSISEVLDHEECRRLLQSIALIHPDISFTLKNEATGEMSLQLKRCTSLYHAFLQMFGKTKVGNLRNINYQNSEYEISGCISTDCHVSKDFQFLYVNKRLVLHTKLHKLINSFLNKALSSKQKSNSNVNNLISDDFSPSKNQCMCIFALNISCRYDKYDIVFEPRKTMIEFSDWPTVLKVVEDSLVCFLKQENLYSNSSEDEVSLLNVNFETNFHHSHFDIQDCKHGLFSNAAHRLQLVSECSDTNKNNIIPKNIENITQKNLEDQSTGVSNLPICLKQNLIPNFDKNCSTSSEEPSSVIKCANTLKSSVSVLDSLKLVKAMTTNYKNMESCLSNSQEIESSIPCRSIFPSESPVMLRVPVKSTLSDLQTNSSNSNFHKLKEKFQYLPKREKMCPLNDTKCNRKPLKECVRSNSASKTLSFSKGLLQSHADLNKGKSETKECNQMNWNHKSSQCPSLLFIKVQKQQCNNVCDTGDKERYLKMTEHKSLQFPSVSSEKEARIVSRFTFEKESTNLPLQCLRQSGKIKRKSLQKACSKEIIATAEDLLNHSDNDNEITRAKRLRSCSSILNENTVFDVNNTIEESKNNELNIKNLQDDRTNSEVKISSKFYKTCKLDVPSENASVNGTSKAFAISEESKNANLNQLECSIFNLQAFAKSKSVKNSAIVHALTGLGASHKFEKNTFQNDNLNICTSLDQQNDIQNFSTSDMSVEVFKDLESVKNCVNKVRNTTPEYSFKINEASVVESMLMVTPNETSKVKDMYLKLKPSKKKNENENMLETHSKLVSSYLDNIKSGITSSNPDIREDSGVFIFQNENFIEYDKTPLDIQIESSRFVLQTQTEHNLEDNTLLFNSDEMHNNINFRSDLFTEHLPFVLEGCSLKQKCSQENNNNECMSTCISQDSTTEPSSLNVDVEITEGNHKSINSNIEVLASNLSSNLENKELNQNEGFDGENVINSVCSVINGINLHIWASNDKIHNIVNQKDLYDKESENYTNQWKLHSGSKSRRKIYIDTATGNSSYIVPERHEIQMNQNIETNSNEIETMLKKWDNPMFDIPFEVTSVTGNKIPQNISQMYSFLNSYRFSKTTLSTLQVVGQVDCKFIACILRDFNENCKDQMLLALFDQHAVHERIRLEELIDDLYESDQNGGKVVKTTTVCPPLEVAFNEEEITLLYTYHEKLQGIGIHLNIDNESNICSVCSVPACLVYENNHELRRSVSDSIVILQNSIKEWLTSLLKTRSIPQVLPKTLLSVLNYQACRGAVKFGDPLSLEQCKDLLKSLSGCKLPFQCAHGRPSVAPILDLKKIEALYKERPPPQLRTLFTHFQK